MECLWAQIYQNSYGFSVLQSGNPRLAYDIQANTCMYGKTVVDTQKIMCGKTSQSRQMEVLPIEAVEDLLLRQGKTSQSGQWKSSQ